MNENGRRIQIPPDWAGNLLCDEEYFSGNFT